MEMGLWGKPRFISAKYLPATRNLATFLMKGFETSITLIYSNKLFGIQLKYYTMSKVHISKGNNTRF